MGLLALLQVAHWQPLQFRMGFRADGRAGSTLGNPVYAGSYLALVAFAGGGIDDVGAARAVGARPMIWQTAIKAIVDRPVLGWGPNNFRFASFRHATVERLRAEPGSRDADAHDLVLEVAATWGIPGLLLLLGWMAAVAVGLLRGMRGGPPAAWHVSDSVRS